MKGHEVSHGDREERDGERETKTESCIWRKKYVEKWNRREKGEGTKEQRENNWK